MAFVVFEGLDGSGKSTLISFLESELNRRSISFCRTREPGGTPLAEEMRGLLLRVGAEVPSVRAELLLYQAARNQHVHNLIAPALKRGDWVICDRFTASSVAFQSFARGVERKYVDWLNDFAVGEFKPDLNILLDLPAEVSLSRVAGRAVSQGQNHDRFEIEPIDFHRRVREGFLTQANEDPQRWLVLDATKTPQEMSHSLQQELFRRRWLES
jgi:dTMP kinase